MTPSIDSQMTRPPDMSAEHPISGSWSLLAIIAISIFLVEMLIMFALERWPIQSPLLATLADALLLTVIAFPVLYFFVYQPITGLKLKLQTSEDAFKAIFVDSFDGILAIDGNGIVQYANDVATMLLNRPMNNLVGSLFGMPLSASSITQIEIPQKQGHLKVIEMHVMNSIWDGQNAFLVSLHDITQHIEHAEELLEQSMSDELTGLKNRRGFYILAEQQLKLAERRGDLLLFYVDLDGMKHINDTYGHRTGDQALTDMAQVLRRTFRDSDIIARMGGDEFAIVAIAAEGESEQALCKRLLSHTETHNRQAGRDYQLRLSYGIANYVHDRRETLAELVSRADALMYQHKQARKSSKKWRVESGR